MFILIWQYFQVARLIQTPTPLHTCSRTRVIDFESRLGIIYSYYLRLLSNLSFIEQLIITDSNDLMVWDIKKIYDFSSLGEITSKKSSSFLRGPRVPIILLALPFWTVIEIAWIKLTSCIFVFCFFSLIFLPISLINLSPIWSPWTKGFNCYVNKDIVSE